MKGCRRVAIAIAIIILIAGATTCVTIYEADNIEVNKSMEMQPVIDIEINNKNDTL